MNGLKERNMKKYDIIYADPAWSYYNDKTVLLDENKAKDFISRNPYKVMSTKDIQELPIKNMSAEKKLQQMKDLGISNPSAPSISTIQCSPCLASIFMRLQLHLQ